MALKNKEVDKIKVKCAKCGDFFQTRFFFKDLCSSCEEKTRINDGLDDWRKGMDKKFESYLLDHPIGKLFNKHGKILYQKEKKNSEEMGYT